MFSLMAATGRCGVFVDLLKALWIARGWGLGAGGGGGGVELLACVRWVPS
jgi:hypothetical protein